MWFNFSTQTHYFSYDKHGLNMDFLFAGDTTEDRQQSIC